MNQPKKEMQKLISVLDTIVESDEYTMLVKSYDQENTLEYGIVGQPMKAVSFDHLQEENFWEFIYEGMKQVNPNTIVHAMNVSAFGNLHSSAILQLNEKVQAIITNSDHKYDGFIAELQMISEQEEIKNEKSEVQILKKEKRIQTICELFNRKSHIFLSISFSISLSFSQVLFKII